MSFPKKFTEKPAGFIDPKSLLGTSSNDEFMIFNKGTRNTYWTFLAIYWSIKSFFRLINGAK